MIKLVFDLKCGYEKDYAEIKDYSFDLSFLCDEAFYRALAKASGEPEQSTIPTEDDLMTQYALRPEALIKDNGLGSALYNCASADVARRRFPETLSAESAPFVFPELFVIRNMRLERTDGAEKESGGSRDYLMGVLEGMYDLSDECREDVESALAESPKESDSERNRKA